MLQSSKDKVVIICYEITNEGKSDSVIISQNQETHVGILVMSSELPVGYQIKFPATFWRSKFQL